MKQIQTSFPVQSYKGKLRFNFNNIMTLQIKNIDPEEGLNERN